ncbi:hypothetical protein BKA65DRAFT_293028 [Rhexocercosporidium sp. MPI-PUGE-AT-0058]|nr:hypothetical protein BKA65DRAFT_293028 [Rhexocercosporidium sp. MPI-PUGE-AT-0058]
MLVSAGWRGAIVLGLVGGSWASYRDTELGKPDDDGRHGAGVQKVVQEQRILLPTATVKSAIIVSHPKITDGPSLVRRKLGSIKWDMIHDGIQGQKRDLTACPVDFNLCPKSMNGGCCPKDRVCGTSSCFPSSAAPASACGRSNYVACGIAEGGGCCPDKYQCATNGCIPLAGVTDTPTCSANFYLCPASLNYGCCQSGFACALSTCYATSISTFTYTATLTTTDADRNPHTLTTTIISATVLGAPEATETTDPSRIFGKYTPSQTASEKVKATGTKDSGLTTPEIGGIIGGAVAILIVILIASFFIIKRLNRAIKVSELANSNTHSSSSGHRSRPPIPRNQEIDAMSVDPLMMTASEASGSFRRPYGSRNPSSTTHYEVEANSPPSFTSPFPPTSPPHTQYQQGYNPVSSTESQYSSSSGGGGYRNPSLDSTPPMRHNPNAGYFDLPLQTQTQHDRGAEHRRSQVSQISPQIGRRPSHHGRNWSDASDISQISHASSPTVAELEATERDGESSRRSSSGFSRVLQGLGMGRSGSTRRRSDPVPLPGGPVRTPDWTTPSPREGLGFIPEAGESAVRLEVERGISDAQFNGGSG